LKNFNIFFSQKYNFTLDDYLISKTFNVDVYDLLAEYVFYLTSEYLSPDGFKLSTIAIKNTVNTVRNFLEYHDIDINPRKYKIKVKPPKVVRQRKEALSKDDVIKILQTCVTPKLRLFVHFLAVTGCRAAEACSVRLMDIDIENYKVQIRGEHTKTKEDRYTFITKEFIEQYQEYLKYKYRKRVKYYETGKDPIVVIPKKKETDLLFASYFVDTENESQENQDPKFIYNNLLLKFEKTLDLLDINFENSTTKRRRKISFHSFRRMVKSIISDLGYSDFSEWYIGHAGSTYYRRSDRDKFELFKRIEPYLTFNHKDLEARAKDTESRLEIMEQRNRELTENIHRIMEMIQQNPSLANVKPEVLTKKLH
jgi:integrase